MRNLFLFFIVYSLLSVGFLQAHEECIRVKIEEILCSCRKSIDLKDGKTNLNPNRTWTFNDQVYLLNDAEQWVLTGFRSSNPNSVDEFVEYHSKRGICFKGHPGVHKDTSFYPQGIWYCRGSMHDGSLCPYHLIKQFPPDGIPPR